MPKDLKINFDNISIIAKVSHELRNPIHGIKGICSILRDNWHSFDDDLKKSSIGKIYEAVEDLENLVNKLFESGKDIKCQLERADIIEVANKAINTVKIFNPDETNKVNIFVVSKETELYGNLDSFWIGQVLNNLLVNALKHSRGKNIKIRLEQNRQEIVASVIDDGVGLPKEELGRIFAPFKQSINTATENIGSGLGLSICQQVIESHRGKIWAENNIDKGLNISFTIPIQ